ncbi:MAG: DIP1984 family protein, partial [Anaerolineae bacterium]|nr:DIP1984 family protein [Anaerolineae bacterium]
ADAQKRIQQLRERLIRVVRVQEGDKPAEDPQELRAELARTLDEYNHLVKAINRTNAATPFSPGITLTDALANREVLGMERDILYSMVQAATEQRFMYSRTEIRYVTTFSIHEYQKRIDDLAKLFREMDSAIQALNWQVDLIE